MRGDLTSIYSQMSKLLKLQCQKVHVSGIGTLILELRDSLRVFSETNRCESCKRMYRIDERWFDVNIFYNEQAIEITM